MSMSLPVILTFSAVQGLKNVPSNGTTSLCADVCALAVAPDERTHSRTPTRIAVRRNAGQDHDAIVTTSVLDLIGTVADKTTSIGSTIDLCLTSSRVALLDLGSSRPSVAAGNAVLD